MEGTPVLHIGNVDKRLSYEAALGALKSSCADLSGVVDLNLVLPKSGLTLLKQGEVPPRHRGFAFVQFDSTMSAIRAQQTLNGMYLGVNSVGTELSATMAQGTVTYNRRRQDGHCALGVSQEVPKAAERPVDEAPCHVTSTCALDGAVWVPALRRELERRIACQSWTPPCYRPPPSRHPLSKAHREVAGESNKDDARQHSARGSEKSWRTRRRNQQRENNNQFKHVMVAGMAEDLFAAVLGRVAALVDHEVPAADFPMWQVPPLEIRASRTPLAPRSPEAPGRGTSTDADEGGDKAPGDGQRRRSSMARVLRQVMRTHPQHLRLKELLEAMECFRALEHFIIQGIRKGRIRRILDLCCGHGLLGILLGFRFPTMEVVCVDLNPSRAFQHYKEAIAECADERCSPEQPAPASPHLGQPHDMPDCTEVPDVICSNVRLVQGDAQKVELTEDTLAVCIHGCNGISKDILTRAIAAQCLYAVIPCCIAEGLYGVGITHSGSSDDKYQVSVGIMAGQFHAQRVVAISKDVTPRNLMILGPHNERLSNQLEGIAFHT
ncbi:hypothetical protein CYMTET_50290 [Cymbomonas tetramitiformis]|uniref:RRM domain-containing protein n=1 Tax=Cymbomonas tetramitiformis TaxID=36881 RepID=A0AAE0BPK2_9CHLO|nr:hypothetical protein CYMTET_50290 [Cymbomonas tetramitiformis]